MPLLLLALSLAAADPAAAPPDALPVDEALVERFVAAVPPERRARLMDRDFPPYQPGPLLALNPRSASEIRQLFQEHGACSAPIMARMAENGLRFVARQLGEERLGRMIRFYESGDADFFHSVNRRLMDGGEPSAADEARIERLIADYPLADFAAAVEATLGREEPLFGDLLRCDDVLEAGLQGLNLRLPEEAD